MAVGDLLSFTIRDATIFDADADGYGFNGDGWIGEAVFEGMAVDTSLSAFDAQKVHVTVTDLGFDDQGAPTTRQRHFNGGKVMRRQVPNQGIMMVSSVGGNAKVLFTFEDHIFEKTSGISVTIDAGAYTALGVGSNAATTTTVTNGSTRQYPKALSAWLNQPYDCIRADHIAVEMVAFHRFPMNKRQVAAIKFQASDGAGHTSPEVLVNQVTLSEWVGGNVPECYAASVDLTGLNPGSCNVNAKVYPWFGDAASVLDLSTDGEAMPATRPQHLLPFTNDSAGTYGSAIAFVTPKKRSFFSSGDATQTYNAAGQAEGTDNNYRAGNAFNGTASGNGWLSTENVNVWLGIELVEPRNIRSLRISCDPSNGLSSFDLFHSDTGLPGSWTKRGVTIVPTQPWVAGQFLTFDNIPSGDGLPHKYWKVERPLGSVSAGVLIRELQMAETTGGINVCIGNVSADMAEARKAPFEQMSKTTDPIRAFNAANGGHNDLGGARIYFMDNDGADARHQTGDCNRAAGGAAWCEYIKDPQATGQIVFANDDSFLGVGYFCSKSRFVGIVFDNDSFVPLQGPDGEGGIGIGELALIGGGYVCTNGGRNSAQAYRRAYYRNVHVTGGVNFGGQPEPCQLYGCTAAEATYTPGVSPASSAEGVASIGNVLPSYGFASKAHNTNPNAYRTGCDGAVVYNNHFRNADDIVIGNEHGNGDIVVGYAFIQNLIEMHNSDGGQIAISFSGDGSIAAVDNFIMFFNSIMGNRGNSFYTDAHVGARGLIKRAVQSYNYFNNWNNKSDTFSIDDPSLPTGRVGNFEPHCGVGYVGNVALYAIDPAPGTGHEYAGWFWPPSNESNAHANIGSPQLVDDKSNNPGGRGLPTGAGGGDYHPIGETSALYDRVPAGFAGLTYDLGGALRRNDGSGAAGAYERIDATRIVLEAPSTGRVGDALTVTVRANGIITGSITVNLVDGSAGGIRQPASVTISAAQPVKTIAYTATAKGTAHLTTTNNSALLNAEPVAITITGQTAAVAGPAEGQQNGIMGPYTLTVAGTLLAPQTINLALAGLAGSFKAADGTTSITSLSVVGVNPQKQFYLLPTGAGDGTISFANSGTFEPIAPFDVEVAASALAFTGPHTGYQSEAATFRLALVGVHPVPTTYALGDDGAGGVFDPIVLLPAGTDPFVDIPYLPTIAGDINLAITGGGLPAPLHFAFTAAPERPIDLDGELEHTPDERTITLRRGEDVELLFKQIVDPHSKADWYVRYGQFLEEGETFAAIARMRPTALAAALGISAGTGPYRYGWDRTHKVIRFWTIGDPDFEDAPAFAAGLQKVGIAQTIITTASPPRQWENTPLTGMKQK